jgi:DNA-binding NtrC family response regulator
MTPLFQSGVKTDRVVIGKPSTPRQPTILVVEDQEAERAALVRFLKAEHMDAIGVAGAAEALKSMDQPIDLVVCDVRLGASNGIDVLKLWKERRPHTPFLLITAYGEISDAVEAMKAGAENYLVKPVNPTALLAEIRECLESGPGDQGPPCEPLEEMERAAIERALGQCGGNRTHAAQALGISVRTLQRKLKAWRTLS